jgi:hypothetical protein
MDRKISNKSPNATSQTLRKTRTIRRREIIMRAKINEIETKKIHTKNQ